MFTDSSGRPPSIQADSGLSAASGTLLHFCPLRDWAPPLGLWRGWAEIKPRKLRIRIHCPWTVTTEQGCAPGGLPGSLDTCPNQPLGGREGLPALREGWVSRVPPQAPHPAGRATAAQQPPHVGPPWAALG